jgi:hypothetical protein
MQAAEEGPSPTALWRERRELMMMGEIGVVMGWIRGRRVWDGLSGREWGVVSNAGCRRLGRGKRWV